MTKQQRETGFSVVEGVLVLVVLALVGVCGWLVWPKHSMSVRKTATNNTTKDIQNSQQETQIIPAFDAASEGKQWTTVTKQKIAIADWHVTMSIPATLIGKAIITSVNTQLYGFWLKAANDNPSCRAYFLDNAMADSGLEVDQYDPSFKVGGLFANLTKAEQNLTLDQYYQAHKTSTKNYFQDPDPGIVSASRKYWKVGSNFYIAETVPTLFDASNKPAFTKACPNVPIDYETIFADALATMKPE